MKTLMIPGPTEVSPEVLEELGQPIRSHFGAEWARFYFEVVEKVKKVFQTGNSLFILPSTSSGGMELAVAHAAEPGEKVLICKNGFFGERFEEMAVTLGAEVVTTDSDYGKPITAGQISRALRGDPDIRALAVVHNETSTGVESELSGIVNAARANDVLTIVDCVSSMGGVEVPVDGLGIDFCISGTQKAMGAPCGLGFVSVSRRAWDTLEARQEPVRGWNLNLNILKKYQEMWLGNPSSTSESPQLQLAFPSSPEKPLPTLIQAQICLKFTPQTTQTPRQPISFANPPVTPARFRVGPLLGFFNTEPLHNPERRGLTLPSAQPGPG